MPVPKDEVLELMRMEVDPAEVDEIRELWKEHSKAEDNRSIEGLLATLSEDCVYTVYPDDVSWHGHEGAARFYTELLTAFPDIVFELQNIVIGPQGVVEEAIVTGTHTAKWLDNEPTGEKMTWRNAIFFPWDPESRRFKGERVYTDMPRIDPACEPAWARRLLLELPHPRFRLFPGRLWRFCEVGFRLPLRAEGSLEVWGGGAPELPGV